MMILIIVAGILAALAAVLLIRTALFRPQEEPAQAATPVDVDGKRAVESLAAMVKIPTVSHPDPAQMNESAFEAFRQFLKQRYPQIHAVAEQQRAGESTGIFYKIPGKGKGAPAVLMAHYDVVPPTEHWAHPPFCGQVIDGELWGRGTLDTKGTLCGVMEAAEQLLKAGWKPEADLYLAFAGDEEVQGSGAPSIVAELKRRGVSPSLVLDEGGAIVRGIFPGVDRPCAVVGLAEKGRLDVELTARLSGGHSSAPPAHTAVGLVARAVTRLEAHPFPMRPSPAVLGLFDRLGRQSKSFGIRLVFANLWLFMPVVKKIFSKAGGEMNALLRTTCAATMSSGGSRVNVLPDEASASINLRLNTGDSVADSMERLRKTIGDGKIQINRLYAAEPSHCSSADTEQFRMLQQAIMENWPGTVAAPYLMMASSDSRNYEQICPNVYRFSAMELSKEERGLIHSDNERIAVEKVAQCVSFYVRLMRKL